MSTDNIEATLFPLKNFNAKQLYRQLELSDDRFEAWLKTLGLLHTSRVCVCGGFMQVRTKANTWVRMYRCTSKCCRKEVGFFTGTWFEGSHLTPKEIFQMSYFWCRQTHTQNEVVFDMQRENNNISRVSITEWNEFYREICLSYYIKNPIKIGGPGLVVEIDETCISKRKYNRGRLVSNQQWFFGGVERGSGRCFIIPVERRDAATLLPIIQDYILPGSTIMSDLWAAYFNVNSLPELYTHLTVNHSVEFVNPDTGAHTQTIEVKWIRLKRRHKEELGTDRCLLASYIAQLLWRKTFFVNYVMFNVWGQIRELLSSLNHN